MNQVERAVNFLGASRLVVVGFLSLLIVPVFPLGTNPGMVYSNCPVHIGMNGFLVLAMAVSIVYGAGLSFELPIGILCSPLSGSIAVQFNWSGLAGFWGACVVPIPFALVAGYFYAILLNNVKGFEMMVGGYMAFSIVSLISIVWLVLPYNSPEIVWLITGVGLCTAMTLGDNYDRVLDNFLRINFKQMDVLQNNSYWKDFFVLTGLSLVLAAGYLLMWLFMKTKAGIAMRCSDVNLSFSRTLGVDNSRVRTIGIVTSTVIAAVGVNIRSQSYDFYQFYSAPLIMAFPTMAAILIDGATPKKASVFNAVLGAILFQYLLTLAAPVVNAMINAGSISKMVCTTIQNSIILYALTKIRVSGGE